MKRLFLSLAVIALTAMACGGYGGGAPASQATPATTTGGEIAISASYPKFSLATITLPKGQAKRLKITSRDTAHTFTIDELGINISVGAGETVTREIRADKAGTFTFYCSVPGHRAAGMRGTLQVSE